MGNITQKWVSLLFPFTSDYSGKFSESDLARKTKIPQQTASRILIKLVKDNILSYEVQGRNKLFYLSKQSAFSILQMIEMQKSIEFQTKMIKISQLISEFENYSETIVIFGSYASNKFDKESDLDILFLGKSNKEEIIKIKRKQNLEINEHYATFKEFENSIKEKNPLAIEIIDNHIFFGNISKTVKLIKEAQK